MLSLDKVFDAQTVLKSIIRETNLVRAYGIAPDCELYLKPENLQITGSFKVRGSAYKIAMLSDEEKEKGVIACSAGNHAQGVALAATKNGIKSLICLPRRSRPTSLINSVFTPRRPRVIMELNVEPPGFAAVGCSFLKMMSRIVSPIPITFLISIRFNIL